MSLIRQQPSAVLNELHPIVESLGLGAVAGVGQLLAADVIQLRDLSFLQRQNRLRSVTRKSGSIERGHLTCISA